MQHHKIKQVNTSGWSMGETGVVNPSQGSLFTLFADPDLPDMTQTAASAAGLHASRCQHNQQQLPNLCHRKAEPSHAEKKEPWNPLKVQPTLGRRVAWCFFSGLLLSFFVFLPLLVSRGNTSKTKATSIDFLSPSCHFQKVDRVMAGLHERPAACLFVRHSERRVKAQGCLQRGLEVKAQTTWSGNQIWTVCGGHTHTHTR